MDVSGDGAENSGLDTATARDAALAAGIDRNNGMAILGETGLSEFHQNEIVGRSGSFLLTAASFEDFETAIAQKLQAEITNQPPGMTPIPLPASVWLLIAALGGLGALRASRRA